MRVLRVTRRNVRRIDSLCRELRRSTRKTGDVVLNLKIIPKTALKIGLVAPARASDPVMSRNTNF